MSASQPAELVPSHAGRWRKAEWPEQEITFRVVPITQEATMKDKSSQGDVPDENSQEQPKDKDRAQTAHVSKSGHMPQQPANTSFSR